jgi:hypothetical protein
VSFTNVPESCITGQPRSIASDAGTIFGGASAIAEQLVDLFDMDTALNWLDRVGDLKDAAGRLSGHGIGRREVYRAPSIGRGHRRRLSGE